MDKAIYAIQYPTNTQVLGLSPPNFKGENVMALIAVNVRNQLRGNIKAILWGDVVSEIELETLAGTVTSVITTRSIKELNLAIGSEVLALVKATEVSIAKL